MRTLSLRVVIATCLLASLNACGEKLPDPVERKDGYAYIPIADTAFLIPEKTWLKSYARNSTDGMVDSFYLHVTAPDVKPWSQEINAQMYPPAGPGQRVDVYMKDIRDQPIFNQHENFYKLPPFWGRVLEEIKSDLADAGLRRFRDPKWNDPAFYLRVENERVKYFIRCDNDNGYPANHQFCHLRFPWGRKIYADLTFTRNYLPHSVRMADQIAIRLKEFEASGQAYRPQFFVSKPKP